MVNVLVVDDNDDNRMAIKLLLEDFSDIKIYEAKDGLEAENICKNEAMQLVFMDIMMPKKDGLEALKSIRSFDRNVMIVAVSALDYEEMKKNMIASGAEDYITKPIDSYVFIKRVKNYLELIKNRALSSFDNKAINLYTKEVYNRYMLFRIYDKVSLAEAWEYYLKDDKKKYNNLSDVIRIVYAVCAFMVERSHPVELVSEESDEYGFLTIVGIEYVNETILKNILFRHYPQGKFILKNSKLSFMVPKIKAVPLEAPKEDVTETKKILHKDHSDKISAEEFLESTPLNIALKAEELDEIGDSLDSVLYDFEKSGDASFLVTIADNLKKYAMVMDGMLEFQHLAHAVLSTENALLSVDTSEIDESKRKLLVRVISGLVDDLSRWQRSIFITKDVDDVHYLDSSLLSSALQIESMLKNEEVKEEGEIEFF